MLFNSKELKRDIENLNDDIFLRNKCFANELRFSNLIIEN